MRFTKLISNAFRETIPFVTCLFLLRCTQLTNCLGNTMITVKDAAMRAVAAVVGGKARRLNPGNLIFYVISLRYYFHL